MTLPIEPEINVIRRRDVPRAQSLNLEKGFWEAVIRRLELHAPGEALEISMPTGYGHTSGFRSSIWNAAAKHGMRIAISIRGASVYTWKAGTKPAVLRAKPRKPITCKVCQRAIIRPATGGSRQSMCAAVLGKKSPCQIVVRIARLRGITVEEEKLRSGRYQRERVERRAAA